MRIGNSMVISDNRWIESTPILEAPACFLALFHCLKISYFKVYSAILYMAAEYQRMNICKQMKYLDTVCHSCKGHY